MANAVWQATIVDQSGNVLPGAEVEVVNEATGLPAPLFTTRTGTSKSNPFFVLADGFAQFYAAPGLYRITATSAGTGTTMTWRNVRLVDVATTAEAIAGTAGVLPDAAGVHAAFKQFGIGSDATPVVLNLLSLPSGMYHALGGWLTGIQGSAVGGPDVDGWWANVVVNRGQNSATYTYTRSQQSNFIRQWVGRQSSLGGEIFWRELHHTANGATNAEALAGTNNEKWMSPLRTREALIQSAPRLMRNVSGSSIAADANNAGSGLRFTTFNSSGAITASTTAPAGTWRNAAGVAVANNEYGLFMRVV